MAQRLRDVRRAVHPRVGGEYSARRVQTTRQTGSSPRGRGILSPTSTNSIGMRFIPAWAGNTRIRSLASASIAVHPRVGGEYCQGFHVQSLAHGSSPRGRGIPPFKASKRKAPLVHPRVGGEYSELSWQGRPHDGSSPRGRGIRCTSRKGSDQRRFIPAWAGNTTALAPPPSHPPVHPRVGGEYPEGRKTEPARVGSSPRGRGIRYPISVSPVLWGFIPAWAGNTFGLCKKRSGGPVHPRVGGEYIMRANELLLPYGSSPRGRGILCWGHTG